MPGLMSDTTRSAVMQMKQCLARMAVVMSPAFPVMIFSVGLDDGPSNSTCTSPSAEEMMPLDFD
jgi:hypothetical protein